VVERDPYVLVQSRLAVIDLSPAVVYPMPNETRDVWLLFNGEIYDHKRLRTELERCGHRFRTACDAEVVVHGYEEWGQGVFARLDGMFAAAVLDERRDELLLTRDALGIKPLVHTTGGAFAFASETVPLVEAGLSEGRIDEQQLLDFASLHYIPAPETGLTDVRHVEPGTALVRRRDGTSSQTRWRPGPFRSSSVRPVGVGELGAAFDQSVQRQLVADVEVGVFLSSGVDSSLVLESAVRAGARPLAFTVGFSGHGDYDEQGTARRFAAELGVPHLVEDLDLRFDFALGAVGAAYDQPFADASAIATLALARMAREHVTVALSGTGGDDLFAGYYRHRAHLLARLVAAVPAPVRTRLARGGGYSGDERHSLRALMSSYLQRILAAAGDDPYAQYLQLIGTSSSEAVIRLLGGDPAGAGQRLAELGARAGLGENGEDILRGLQAFELQTYLPSDLLTKEDRATMSVGLEGRVPLLGKDVLALAELTPPDQRATLRSGKRLLRQLAARRLPGYLRRGRKRGFAVPLGDLMRGAWREPVLECLSERPTTLFDGPAAARELRAGRLSATDSWALSVLMAWEARVSSARLSATSTV
jgi:asparagine synthase (glutamine-hydrolysing)